MTEKHMNLEYLKDGSRKQRQMVAAVEELGILDLLSEYTPLIAGSIPIDIDIESSDIDVVCCVYDHSKFERQISQLFSNYADFYIETKMIEGIRRTVCSFKFKGMIFEVFGQPVPSDRQNAYIHMIIENRILELLGESSKEAIRAMKRSGLKTEPAFGRLLELDGDPYKELLVMYNWSDAALKTFVKNKCVVE